MQNWPVQQPRENVATGRGHLYVRKSVFPATAAVGDLVLFTISLDNTGLGSIYNAAFSDTLGSGLRTLFAVNVVTDEIKAKRLTYVLPAVVTSCVGTNNTVAAWWPVGNVNNPATYRSAVRHRDGPRCQPGARYLPYQHVYRR